MSTYARSLILTGALVVAAVVCILVSAAPLAMQRDHTSPPPLPPKPLPPLVASRPAPPPAPPITFADPDGQELILEDLSVRTAIHGMLSLTELDLRFRNPRAERIEGRFTCTLPPNAAISRFAKDVNGHLMEGEVVERLRANQVYESYLHQMRDPALLEQDQGNRFSARIFPIEANASVRLVLSYTTLLPMRGGVRTYTLPLRGLPKVNRLTFRAFVTPVPGEESGDIQKASSSISGPGVRSTAEVVSFEETDYTPDRDVVLTWRPAAGAPRARVLRAGDFYIAAIQSGAAGSQPAERAGRLRAGPSTWRIYVDTSASSAEGAPHRIRALEALLGSLPPGDDVQLVAFDQEIAPLASGPASSLSHRAGELLRARLFLGGTDLVGMLADAARSARDDSSRAIVIASDLVATVGATSSNEVKSAIAAIPASATIHALVLGSREDGPTAKALTAGRGRVVRVPFTESIELLARNAADDLRRPLGGSVDIADAAAEWVYPTRFDDVAPGDEILVLGKVRAGREPEISLARSSARPTTLDSHTFAPLLEREAYRAYLEYLAEREANEPSEAVRRALATEQVRLSIEQRVVIPRTTMLVLENEWEYQRWGLDRRALAAILTVDGGGIGRIDRRNQPPVLAERPPRPRPVPMPRRRDDAKSAPPPPVAMAPVPMPEAGAADFAVDAVSVEEGIPGGVEGGVVGGVVGGTVGGVVSQTITAEAPMVAEAPARIVAPTSVPPPPPAPVPPPRRVEREEKQRDAEWTRRERPPRSRIAELESKLRANPRDRELYNQLSEALAAYDEWSDLRALALRWQPYDPENPQVYEVLGLADEQLGRENEAARAFGSLIEVAPAKTELLQRAGLLLLRARRAKIAEAPLRKALEARPDRANGYRHLALMLWREGRVEEAARVLESATRQTFPNWYGNVQRVIREELGYVYRAWLRKDPSRSTEIAARAREHGVDLDRTDALRVTLAWETDANDVDLHVVDPSGEECFYSNKTTRSGLTLYEDITEGLGPEVIRTSSVDRGTYHVGVRYFNAGPMGVSRGLVVVMRNDQVEIHPFRLVQGGKEIRYVTGVTVK